MKTSKMLKKLSILVLSFIIILLTQSCTNDENDFIKQEKNVVISKVSFNELLQKRALKNVLENIKKNKNFKNNRNSIANDASFIILTDSILEAKTDSTTNYTFSLQRSEINNTVYENFIISKFGDTYNYFIIKYELLNQNDFQNMNIEVTPVDESLININDLLRGEGNNVIDAPPCVEVIYAPCTLPNGGHGGADGHGATEQPGGGMCTGSFPILINYSGCFGGGPYSGGDANSGPTTVGNPNTNGGTFSGAPNGPTATITNSKPNYLFQLISNNFSKNDPVWNFINSFGVLPSQINTYLENNNNSSQAQNTGLNLINFVIANNYSVEAQSLELEYFTIVTKIPNAKFDRFKELKNILKNNPWALIQDCAQQEGMNTSNYIDLYYHTIPSECQNRLDDLGIGWSNQPISDGNVPLANIDYYGVEITSYPDFDGDNNPDTEGQIYQEFRNQFTDLASGSVQNFEFSCTVDPINGNNTGDISWDFIPYSSQDTSDFTSNNPIASILLIEADSTGFLPTIATDDGAIIVSGYNLNEWTISTITTPNNGSQPFSGNRQWGWIINQSGNLELFTRAVDVANISKLLNIGANTECQQETYYDIAAATWQNLQQEIQQWVTEYGGQATIKQPQAVHVDRNKIIELLVQNETIDEINCD